MTAPRVYISHYKSFLVQLSALNGHLEGDVQARDQALSSQAGQLAALRQDVQSLDEARGRLVNEVGVDRYVGCLISLIVTSIDSCR